MNNDVKLKSELVIKLESNLKKFHHNEKMHKGNLNGMDKNIQMLKIQI